ATEQGFPTQEGSQGTGAPTTTLDGPPAASRAMSPPAGMIEMQPANPPPGEITDPRGILSPSPDGPSSLLNSMPSLTGEDRPAPRDEEVQLIQAPGGAPAGDAPDAEGAFVLPADKLTVGQQAVGLTVNVIAPQVVNLRKETKLRIVVRNTGQ